MFAGPDLLPESSDARDPEVHFDVHRDILQPRRKQTTAPAREPVYLSRLAYRALYDRKAL